MHGHLSQGVNSNVKETEALKTQTGQDQSALKILSLHVPFSYCSRVASLVLKPSLSRQLKPTYSIEAGQFLIFLKLSCLKNPFNIRFRDSFPHSIFILSS